jgi:methylated-DNA-[protein]-cysteine S-methyltransferase
MTGPVLYDHAPSPLGPLLLTSDGEALTGVFMEEHRYGPTVGADWARDAAPFGAVREQLAAYFAGDLQEFSLTVRPAGTPFQQAVWRALQDIPYGATESYGALARHLGDPGAVRAVGAANGRNPVSIVIPCHRVVGADGALTGYGGGMENKRRLLALESPQGGLFA